MENVLKEIKNLKERSNLIAANSRKSKILLYSEGLKEKLMQVDFALGQLSKLRKRSDKLEDTTESDVSSISKQIGFYCDTFWTFLFSSLDVLSQIVNQGMKLGLNEENVSFLGVLGKLQCRRL